jgi:hypothetical protein
MMGADPFCVATILGHSPNSRHRQQSLAILYPPTKKAFAARIAAMWGKWQKTAQFRMALTVLQPIHLGSRITAVLSDTSGGKCCTDRGAIVAHHNLFAGANR